MSKKPPAQRSLLPEEPQPPSKSLTRLGGYAFSTVVSALQKEIRRGRVDEAVFWGLILHHEAPSYAWKRVLVCSAEDVGLAAPEVVARVCAYAEGYALAKVGSWYVSPHLLTLAITELCRAPKSTEIEDLQSWTLERIKAGDRLPILPEYEDAHTEAGKAHGATWPEWYRDRHTVSGIPVNAYTRRLWALKPDYDPDLVDGAGTE